MSMNAYRMRKWLWLAAGVLAAASPVVVVVALVDAPDANPRLPAGAINGTLPSATGSDSPPREPGVEFPSEDHALPPLDHYAVIWQRELRAPLFDPPPQVVAAAPKPRLTVRLLGTVVEPGGPPGESGASYAMLATASGGVLLRKVGDTVDQVEIVGIGDGEVAILFAGERQTLTVEKSSAAGEGKNP